MYLVLRMAQPDEDEAPGSFEQLALSTLESRMDAERARRVLDRALRDAEVERVPEDAVGFGLFVCGALTDAIERETNRGLAESIVATLEPRFAGGDARRSGVKRKTPLAARRTILLFSRDEARAEALREQLDRPEALRVASDAFALLAEIDELGGAGLVLVVADDLIFPTGPLLELLEGAVPESTAVIFWGGTPPEPLSLPSTVLDDAEAIAACCAPRPDQG